MKAIGWCVASVTIVVMLLVLFASLHVMPSCPSHPWIGMSRQSLFEYAAANGFDAFPDQKIWIAFNAARGPMVGVQYAADEVDAAAMAEKTKDAGVIALRVPYTSGIRSTICELWDGNGKLWCEVKFHDDVAVSMKYRFRTESPLNWFVL